MRTVTIMEDVSEKMCGCEYYILITSLLLIQTIVSQYTPTCVYALQVCNGSSHTKNTRVLTMCTNSSVSIHCLVLINYKAMKPLSIAKLALNWMKRKLTG